MQQFKVKISKPIKEISSKSPSKESSIIKKILPEIEYYRFDELTPEPPDEFGDFRPFDDIFFDSEDDLFETKKKNKKAVQAKKPRFFVEFSVRNFNQPVEIDLSKVNQVIASHEEIQQQVQSAYDKGFEDGQQVTQLALNEEFNKFQNWLKNIDSVAENLRKAFAEELKSLGGAVVPIAIKIAEHILRKEVEQNPEIIVEQVQKALEIIENETILKLRINPDDLEVLRTVGSRLPQIDSIQLIADGTIERGGCILETSIGTIDSTFASQLNKIAQSLNNLDFNIDEINV